MALYASGRKALSVCDVCGFPYKLRQLKSLTKNGVQTNTMACPECWNPQHPQDDLGKYRIEDAQAIRNPRPDHAEYASGRSLVFQIPSAVGAGFLEAVSVSVA